MVPFPTPASGTKVGNSGLRVTTTEATKAGRASLALNRSELLGMINLFVTWLENHGAQSYDPYDIWGTRYGLWARSTYYQKGAFGVPFIAPILMAEVLCPQIRGWFLKKLRYATADAQLALGFLNLYHSESGEEYLQKARELGRDLLHSSIPGYSGYCWGYPFDWQCNTGLWRKNTPYITATPYAFEALLGLYDATQEEHYLRIARSAARFVCSDLKDTPTSENAAAASYSPCDETKVINASAYRAFVLFEAARRFENDEYGEKARKNLNFVLETQRADGSWLYSVHSPAEQFIDHFHTCFVLKNLYKLNGHLQEDEVTKAIKRGYDYYRRELFDQNDIPKSFAIQSRTQIVRLEMYNFAEAITLGTLLKDKIPGALPLAHKLARLLNDHYQLPEGFFVTRVYLGGLRHTLPFLRWPQSQLFYALTNLLLATDTTSPQPSVSFEAPRAYAEGSATKS